MLPILPSAARADNFPLRLDHVAFDRVTHQLAHGMDFELAHDIGAMRFRCLDGDSESYSDFFAAFTFCYELHDFSFPLMSCTRRYINSPAYVV